MPPPKRKPIYTQSGARQRHALAQGGHLPKLHVARRMPGRSLLAFAVSTDRDRSENQAGLVSHEVQSRSYRRLFWNARTINLRVS